MTNKNNEYSIKAISPIDGRYSSQIDQEINNINSEFGLIKKRLYIEIKWFIFLLMKTVFTLKFQIKRTFYRYFIYSVFVFVTHILV